MNARQEQGMNARGGFAALWQLTRRNLKIFLKDKANIFFSLLCPLIVLALYVLFLGDTQADAVLASLAAQGVTGAEDAVGAFCDSWMVAGVLSSATVTVPLCACGVMVQDRRRGIAGDLAASPVPAWAAPASYFLSAAAAGLALSAAVTALAFAWLALAGSWCLSAADVFACLGVTVLSVVCSTALLVFVVGFIGSEGAFTGLNVILGTVIGFLIGAYMPLSMFPAGVQYFAACIPGTHAAGLFRNCLMGGALDGLAELSSPAFAGALADEFALRLNFFGHTAGISAMLAAVAGATVLFLALLVLTRVLAARPARKARTSLREEKQ